MTGFRTKTGIAPGEIHGRLRRHLQVDGLPVVLDLARSHGAFLYEALAEREIIDLFTCFGTSPLGFNHPRVTDRWRPGSPTWCRIRAAAACSWPSTCPTPRRGAGCAARCSTKARVQAP